MSAGEEMSAGDDARRAGHSAPTPGGGCAVERTRCRSDSQAGANERISYALYCGANGFTCALSYVYVPRLRGRGG